MPSLLPEDVAAEARAVYDRLIRPRVEPGHRGEFLVLNIETGEYEVDADDLAASKRAKARFPGATLFAMRVGATSAYRLGGRFVEHRP